MRVDLLKPIECLTKSINVTREIKVLKARWLCNVHLILNRFIKKSTFGIHLLQLKSIIDMHRYTNDLKMGNIRISFMIIPTFDLGETCATNLSMFHIIFQSSSSLFLKIHLVPTILRCISLGSQQEIILC